VIRFAALDRDGTLIVERHYLADPAGVELLPGAAEGLRQLRALGLGLVVVTNQSGIGRGYLDLARLEQIHARLVELLAAEGVTLDGIYACPHVPADDCSCRKPRPGLLHQAAAALGFPAHQCVVIGDKECEIELGRSVGAATVLVRTGYGAAVEAAGRVQADAVVDDLIGAADFVRRRRD
jgi:D-glycero-D-manno-heptose 1,7-bisphosphate phosphatase